MRHLTRDDVRRIAELADACRRRRPPAGSAAGPVAVVMSDVPPTSRPAHAALAAAVGGLGNLARAELVALMWLGGDVGGDGRDPLKWPALVARARAVSAGPIGDAAYVAGKGPVLADRLRAGLAALDAVEFN